LYLDNGGRHSTVPHSPSRLLSFPLQALIKSKTLYVKNLSFAVYALPLLAPLGATIRLVKPGVSSSPPPRNGDPAFPYSYRAGSMLQGVSYVQISAVVVYIRKHNTHWDVSTPLAVLGRLGRGYSDFLSSSFIRSRMISYCSWDVEFHVSG
jgi:hypothetical protein